MKMTGEKLYLMACSYEPDAEGQICVVDRPSYFLFNKFVEALQSIDGMPQGEIELTDLVDKVKLISGPEEIKEGVNLGVTIPQEVYERFGTTIDDLAEKYNQTPV